MRITIPKELQNFEAILVPAFSDDKIECSIATVCDEIKKVTGEIIEKEKWEWKAKEVKDFTVVTPDKIVKVILIGLGKKEKFTTEILRKSFYSAVKKLRSLNVENCLLAFDQITCEDSYEIMRVIIETMVLADYKFTRYKSKDKKQEEINVFIATKKPVEELNKAIEEGQVLACSTMIARDLINEPANTIYPETLAQEAIRLGKDSGFEVEVLDEKAICELKMDSFWAVAKGSDLPPRFIIMRYWGDKDNKDKIFGMVGKGLTYDSGGYAIKPATGMVTMKGDMGGSAAVIGAMNAIAGMKLKVNAIAVVAACENMVSGRAYRNGDIINSMAGKTIEIGNTDAEGRLTLIDAVHYIIEKEKVSKVVDIATLTGAVVAALGKVRMGVVSNNEDFYSQLEEASEKSGEKVWRLPHDEEYRELLKSDIADIKNVGGRFAGTITAGLFIRDFVQDKPWIHLDIAGTSWSNIDNFNGGSGSGTRILYYLAKNYK